MFCCVDVLVEVAPSTFTVHFVISLIQYMLESIVLSMCSFAAAVQKTKCYYKLQVVFSAILLLCNHGWWCCCWKWKCCFSVYRRTTGRVRLGVDKTMNQTTQQTNITSQQSRFWSPISSRLLQPCCCEMSFSPNHFSCCTNVAALFSFFWFLTESTHYRLWLWNLATATRMLFACVPELERIHILHQICGVCFVWLVKRWCYVFGCW